VLYHYALEEEAEGIKLQAAMHGAKIKDEYESGLVPSPNEDQGFVFQDPADYDNLSDAERKELTRKMMGRHKAWAGEKKPLGGQKVVVENPDG
jgi:hypothetical protein